MATAEKMKGFETAHIADLENEINLLHSQIEISDFIYLRGVEIAEKTFEGFLKASQ